MISVQDYPGKVAPEFRSYQRTLQTTRTDRSDSGSAKSFALKILSELYPYYPHQQTIDQTPTVEEPPFQDTEITQVLKAIPQNKTPGITTGRFTNHTPDHKNKAVLRVSALGLCFGISLTTKSLLKNFLLVQAFADDFVFHICSGTRDGLKILAQQALDIFNTSTDKNQLQISTSKSTFILIEKLVRGPTIKWGTESMKRTHIKYLGIILDENLNWAAHIKHKGMKAALTHQRITRIAETTWGLKQGYRRILYSTMAERMSLHGAAAWALNFTSCQKKLLLTIQRKFLLFITEA
ncbi:hypothetical protein AVEN_77358-1 [Araneus ventricosus]|uniref:Reverse transcriptase domain-containing protein n=1 Tax=Araneus ventricosus TaxID=182803 RepID=A0A4Y2C9W4_ARAVE|nr:hypothetical protein AVEN_77358-1 [Araneus ventricosus]